MVIGGSIMIYYTVYKITNQINGKMYIGKHKTTNPNDSYYGSGRAIKQAIRKYGKHNFTKEVLYIFDTEEEMNAKERDVVVVGESYYNMKEGGKGGFGFIHEQGLNKGDRNSMRNPASKAKQTAAMMQTKKSKKSHYDNISRENLKKAQQKNKGKKRPEHATLMKEQGHLRVMWTERREEMRDKLSSWFEVVEPDGTTHTTNRLFDFCKHRGITAVSLWQTSITGKRISKGRNKGWICKKI